LGGDGTFTLAIRSRTYGVFRRTFDLDDPAEFDVRFSEPASVTVSVEGLVGSKLDGKVFLHVQPAGESDNQRMAGRTGIGAGEQYFPLVPSGEVEILIGVNNGIEAGAPYSLFWVVGRHAATLKPGENTVSVRVPELHPLRVVRAEGKQSYIESTKKSRVLLRPVGEYYRTYLQYIAVSARGSVTIPRLAAGTYQISGYIGSEKRSWKRVITIPRDRSVTIP